MFPHVMERLELRTTVSSGSPESLPPFNEYLSHMAYLQQVRSSRTAAHESEEKLHHAHESQEKLHHVLGTCPAEPASALQVVAMAQQLQEDIDSANHK
jgi:hypothetical protein